MSIKYYNLAKDEELPEEFCAVRNVNGEPSEYTWYERMGEFERELWVLFNQSDWFAGSEYRKLQAENAKLRELVRDMWEGYNDPRCEECHLKDTPTCADCPICAREAAVIDRMRELGVVE